MSDVRFDYGALREKIHEKFRTESEFAAAVGIGRVSLSKKLNDQTDFTRKQILTSLEVLDIPACEVDRYFFSAKVRNDEV